MPRLNFDITGDNSNMVKALEDTRVKIDSVSKTIEQVGEGLDLKTAEDKIKVLEELVEEYDESIKKNVESIQEYYDKANEAAQAGDFEEAEKFTRRAKDQAVFVEQLTDRVKEYELALSTLKDGLGDIAAAEDKVAESEKKHNGIMVSLLGGQENYNKILSQMPDGLKSAIKGLNGMTGAAKAFIATPIGIIIAGITFALQALTSWFRNTAEGQMAFAKISGYVSGVLTALRDVVIGLGKSLYDAFTEPKKAVKSLWETLKNDFLSHLNGLGKTVSAFGKLLKDTFTLNFDEIKQDFEDMGMGALQALTGRENFVEDIKQANSQLKEFIANVKDEAEETAQLRAAQEQLHRDRMKWQEDEANLDKQIAELRVKMAAGTDAEKVAAAARAQELINQKYAKQIEFAKEEYRIRKRLNEISESSQQDLDEELTLKAEITRLEAERARSSGRFARTDFSASKNILKDEMDLQNELNNLLMQNEEKRIQLLRDGADKEIEVIQQTYAKEVEAIRQLEEKMKVTNFENNGVAELSAEQEAALTQARLLAEETRLRAIQDLEDKYRLDYLSEYGNFEEKKAAIEEEYEKKIAATSNEYQLQMLRKQREQALKSLDEQYSANYALIFSDASLLTNTLLAQAITNTEDAIKHATESGDIQALTELYARLRAQLGEQATRKYGMFAGIVQGVKDLTDARQALEKAQASNDKTALENALANKSQAMTAIKTNAANISKSIGAVASSLQSFEGTLGKFGSRLASLGSMLEGIVGNMDNIVTAFTSENKADIIASGIQGAVTLVTMFGNQIQQNKEYQDQWNATIRQCAHEYTMLQLEALKYKQENIFGVENPYQRAIDGAKQYQQSMEALWEQQQNLLNGQVQTGTKKAISGKNTGIGAGSGAAVGASIGTIVGGWAMGLGTAIGAAIGAVVGGLSGMLATKTVPIFENLSKQYGRLWDDNYDLVEEVLADYDQFDDATKQLIDNWDAIKDKAKEAEEQMKANFSDLAGDIGNQLSDKLVEAFRNGDVYDAIDDFHEYMTGTIEDIMEQMVFSKTFGSLFNQLDEMFMSSFGDGGDGSITDDLIWFTENYGNTLSDYEAAMKEVQAMLAEQGYDLWGNGSRQATATGIARADQDSVDELNGRATAIQGHTYLMSESMKVISASTIEIQNSVATIQNLAADMVDSLRAIRADVGNVKSNVDTMTTKGVKMLS